LVHSCNPSNRYLWLTDSLAESVALPSQTDVAVAAAAPTDTCWWKTLYRHMPAMCLVVDEAGRVEQVSQMAAQRLGYEPDALLGNPLSSLVSIPALDLDGLWWSWLANPQRSHTWHTCLCCQDRMPVPVQIHVQVVRREERVAVILLAQEMLKGKGDRSFALVPHNDLELALQQSRTELAYVLDTASAAIFNMRVFPDDRWEYDYISAGCEQVYGYGAAAHYADPYLWRRILHPSDADRVIAEMTAAIRSEQPLSHGFRIFHKDGSTRWITSRYSSQWDAALQCWRVIVVDFDVSDRHRTEAALHQSEARLAEAQQIAQLGYWDLDLPTWEMTWSKELYCIHPWNLGTEINLRALLQQFPGPDRKRLVRAVQTAIRHGEPFVLDLSLVRPDGTPCFLEVRGKVMVDRQGRAVRLYGTTQDITQRKHLEHQLAWKSQREQLLNQVIRAIRHSLDLETVFNTATHQTGHLLKLDRALITQYLPAQDGWLIHCEYRSQEQMPSMRGQVIPGQGNPLSDQLKRLETVRVQTRALQDSINQELAHQAPGNWLLVALSVDGQLWGSLSLVHAQVEPDWQDWEVELAEAIADQLAIAIQQSELFHQVKHLNSVLESTVQERTAQLTRSLQHESLMRRITDRVRDSLDENHILQTAVQELLHELRLECCDAGIYNLEQQTSTIAYESTGSIAPARHTTIQMADYPGIYHQLFTGLSFQFCDIQQSNHRQKSHLYTMLVCPIYDDQGSLGDLWLFRPCEQLFDTLEVRLVEQVANQCAIALRQSRLYDAAQRQVEELAKLNQLKDDFLSTVSHELRSPMANIKMATEMLELYLAHTEILIDEKTRSAQYFRILRDECERESTLINDLLDLSRLEADSEPLICSTLHLYDWILHLSEAFLHRTSSQNQHLEFDLSPDIPPLTTDFIFLQRILTELLHNACKYTPPGETITLSLQFSTVPPRFHPNGWESSSQALWKITVANTGVEIPPAEQERIFEKFYRIPNSDPWRTGGTGLGLALVKKRVERLGGQIHVISANLQTAFVITLPSLF